jgi:hypothetical protein
LAGVGGGISDIAKNGFTLGNTLQVVGGLLGTAGDFADLLGGLGKVKGAGKSLSATPAPKSVDLMEELGQLGGKLFPAEKIPALVKYLDRRGIYLHQGINGSFDGVRGVMTLPKNPTRLNVRHELAHMLDYKKYGDDYYKLFTPAQREQMVLDRLKNNRIWEQLNDLERNWSQNYPSTR